MTINTLQVYQPNKLPLTENDLTVLNQHRPPRRGWCYSSGIVKLESGLWQWHGQCADGSWHEWGPVFQLSV